MIFPYFYILELLNWLQLNQELGEYFAFVDTTFNFCIIFRPVLTKKGQRLFVTNARVVLSCAGCPGHYIQNISAYNSRDEMLSFGLTKTRQVKCRINSSSSVSKWHRVLFVYTVFAAYFRSFALMFLLVAGPRDPKTSFCLEPCFIQIFIYQFFFHVLMPIHEFFSQ